MNDLITPEVDQESQVLKRAAKKAFLLNVVFFALLIALYFVNKATGFLDSLVTRLFE